MISREASLELLRFARVTPPGAQYRGRSVHELEGRPFLTTGRDIEPVDPAQVTGQELFGRRAIRRGALEAWSAWSASQGSPPWRLFDSGRDPGEQPELNTKRPADLQALVSHYEPWARAHGVLATPRSSPEHGAGN